MPIRRAGKDCHYPFSFQRTDAREIPLKPALKPVPDRARPVAPGTRENEGHGRRLTAAFEALELFPALAESRNRVLRLVREEHTSAGDVVAAIESDVSLVIAVLRIANRTHAARKTKISSVPKAVEAITPAGVEALAARAQTFDFFERTPGWDLMPERFRLHAVATQSAADRLARELDFGDRDELLCSALLHDVGKLVCEQPAPGGVVRCKRACAENNVTPDGVGARVDRTSGSVRAVVGMHANAAEIMPKTPLHESTCGYVERLP